MSARIRFTGIPLLLAGCLAVAGVAMADGLTEVLRGAREVNRTARQTTALYKEARSVVVPVIAPRTDSVAIDPERVILYSAAWCGYCTQARKFMQSRQVAFVEYDIEQSPRGYADYRALNGSGVPILLIGDQRLSGWSASSFDQMYARFKSGKGSSAVAKASGGKPATSVGDVVVAKIANVPIYSSPEKASVMTLLAKGEEVVVLQQQEGDFIQVQAAAGVGYVDRRLVK